eukprot:GHUV01010866.1.p1 GENE.GHUV01010866.1~~GHUV01010866.1.p1  ORF type:complete len:449 (+),score=124.72 GHUV01010866.1:208-1554(+)
MGAFSIHKIDSLFKNTNLDELMSPQAVVILKDTATVEQALKTLAAKRILSAPVVSTAEAEVKVPPGAHWPQEKGLAGSHQIMGFLDVRDVLSSFLAELEGTNMAQMKMLQKMRILEDKGQSYATTQIKDLKVFGGDGDFFHISEAAQTTIKELVMNGLLNPTERGTHRGKHIVTGTVHRVAVYDNQFRLQNIISQTDIIRFLHMNKADLGDMGSKTAAELGWCPRPVVSLGPETSAIEAMLLMNQKQISAVAVVDGVGKIIGNFSISEMRTIMAEHFGALALPVGEFLALEHGTEFQGYSHIHEQEVVQSKGHKFITDRVSRARPRTPGEEVGQALVLVKPNAPFTEILDKIVNHRIHRVYVIDDDEKPCGVVTCTDVLRLVIKATQHQLKVAPTALETAEAQQQDGAGAATAAAAEGAVGAEAVQPEIMDVQADQRQQQQQPQAMAQ